ncbi:hypothetical protein METBIDRAFT_11400 [Metschnikowia bicuspidata var. bicuspidata NRRL YB-4993]|uniref:Uncharacterized protein n=1 Tax=Metschnikowia bicuspidata var. bicuspidata NRRL YB-4993 TaxID=869754 RepID=A0A1A0HEN4_9ASCO|nr:hypothetical protein METBIDRAFT_11400 [Metschnikowia bicuspidata var. bicuspidata NRRL YB-4993]OBA22584.1 hypothetical protein METBIDRAFT_11400 [Metschnikowia bicuspidata var. bicuspidata NRRL YB-4993]
MSALKNLTSLKRNITRRLRQALEELQENLGNLGNNLERQAAPVRIPVPARGGAPFRGRNPMNFLRGDVLTSGRRSARFLAGLPTGLPTGFLARGLSSLVGSRDPRRHGSRFFTTYNRLGAFSSWRWARLNQSVLFHHFSSKSQFRLKAFHRFYNTPALTHLLKKNGALGQPDPFMGRGKHGAARRSRCAVPERAAVASSLRLNLLLSPRFHDMVQALARPLSPQPSGCYVDFALQPKFLIPPATVMNADVVGELQANLQRFERQVAELQEDLLKISELGELPLKLMAAEGVLRVFFPNCDRAQLECLLVEKNVRGGVIHEDACGLYEQLQDNSQQLHDNSQQLQDNSQQLQDNSQVTPVSEAGVLSSGASLDRALSRSASSEPWDDILSLSGVGSGAYVHLERLPASAHAGIADGLQWS